MEIERIVLSKKASPIAYSRKENGELDTGRVFTYDPSRKDVFEQAREQLEKPVPDNVYRL